MKSNRTLGWVGVWAVAVAVSVLSPATTAFAIPATPTAPAQSGYDGYLEEGNAWAVDALNLGAAWEATRGEGVTVAVIDTGMSEHPFFEDKDVQAGYSTYSDDEDAWNDRPPEDVSDPEDTRGHGTGVASMALQAAPGATILPVRTGTGEPNEFGLFGEGHYEAIRWATDNGADVIVMAWGLCCDETDEDFAMALQYAIDHDVVLAAAAGNDETRTTSWHFPAAIPGVVTVSGVAEDGGAWESGTTGPEVEVAGPADHSLWWPMPQGNPHQAEDCDWCPSNREEQGPATETSELYYQGGGTSAAVGWIGGVVALIRAAHPDLDANNVIQRLIQTAQDRGDEGRDDVFGHGVPDAAAAVTADVESADDNPLGYPLGIAGASGETATGEPAPGTGATADGAAGTDSDDGGSDAVPLGVVAVLAAVLAGAGWLVLQKRSPVSRGGSRARTASAASSPLGLGLAVTLVVAIVAAAGTYLGADAIAGETEAEDAGGGPATSATTGEPADGATPDGANPGGATPGGAEDSAGQTAAEGNPAAMAAQAWQDAYTAGDLEAFRSLTCENPWYRVAINVMKLEDPNFVRPGFAILEEAHFDDNDGDWQGESYRLARQSDTRAWVDAGNFDIGGITTPTYQIALVLEDGEWKVCDFWFASDGGWYGIPEWEDRWPDDADPDSQVGVPT